MKNKLGIFKNGLATGLFLQLAVGPVFFYIANLTLQRSIYDGFIAVLAVTIVDYFYIILAIFGIGKLLENEKIKNIFGIVSSVILMIFGIIIIKGILYNGASNATNIEAISLLSSFTSVFILTISSPMTILFFTGLFTAKAVEYNYTKKDLYIFGLSVGLATLTFLGLSVIFFSLLRENFPLLIIQVLNLIVGLALIGYGIVRIIKILNNSK